MTFIVNAENTRTKHTAMFSVNPEEAETEYDAVMWATMWIQRLGWSVPATHIQSVTRVDDSAEFTEDETPAPSDKDIPGFESC